MPSNAPLTSGWEPDVPIEDSLLRQFVFSYADRLARMATAAGGHIGGSDAAAFADAGSPFPFDNGIVLLQPPTPGVLDTVMRQAGRFFDADNPWILFSAWPTPDLGWRGLELVGYPRLMLRLPGEVELPTSSDELRVVEVDSPASQADFENVLVTAYPMPAGAGVVAPGLIGGVVRLFVGYSEGRPVAVSGLAVGHGIVEVEWLATLPGVRSRGFGSALAAEAVRVSPDVPAVLLAPDDGRSLYRRLGFVPLLRTTIWSHSPTAELRSRG